MKYTLLAIPLIIALLVVGYLDKPPTFMEWIRVQNEAVNYEIEAA